MQSSFIKFLASGILTIGFVGSTCWAYYDVLDTGEVLPKGTYRLTGDAQLLTSSSTGLNLGTIIDAGFQDEFGGRALVGFGRTDYFFGGMFKWMPIPDVDDQPAIGFNAGIVYAKWNDSRDTTFRMEPLISKKFAMESKTVVTPYASLPIGLRVHSSSTQDSGTYLAWQLALGSQLQIEKWKNLQFMGEVGLDLGNAYSYVSVAAVWYFDDQNGFQLK